MSTYEITSAKTIEDLTDDALFLIFKNLNNTEIINVSSVCRRWRDLAFHYSVWAHRHIKATEIGGRLVLEKILSTIPVVHTLDLTRTTVEDSTIQTILQSSIKIHNFKLYDCTIELQAPGSINALLHHLSKNLQGLSIEVQNHCMQNRICELNLGGMVHLRRLALFGEVHLKNYLEEFNLDCPSLESLDLSRSESSRYFSISDLMHEARAKLKALYLPIYGNRVMLNSVKQCNHLTTISLQLGCIDVVSHLPLIQTLIVYCDSSANPPLTWIRPNDLKELVLHLCRPKDSSVHFLRNIQAQSLTLISDSLCKELELFCSDKVERLILRCHFLRLRHVSVTIATKAAMPNLTFLDISECFLGKGVPPKILHHLRKRFPRLRVRSDKFVGYQKRRELRNNVDCDLQQETDCSDTE